MIYSGCAGAPKNGFPAEHKLPKGSTGSTCRCLTSNRFQTGLLFLPAHLSFQNDVDALKTKRKSGFWESTLSCSQPPPDRRRLLFTAHRTHPFRKKSRNPVRMPLRFLPPCPFLHGKGGILFFSRPFLFCLYYREYFRKCQYFYSLF